MRGQPGGNEVVALSGAFVAPPCAELAVVKTPELAWIVVKPVGCPLHFVKVVTVIAGRRLLVFSFADNVELLAG